jgi:phosphoribosyl 1,2-cyclic phosphodiesterase
MLIRFWGVRGTIPCPGGDTLRYGGNTACVEVRCGERLIILDGGTGLRPLADALCRTGKAIDADLFFSHCHLDHIIGAPLFGPFHAAKNRFRLWAGNLAPASSLKQVMRSLMAPPLFPVPPDIFNADVEYRDFKAGETLEPHPGITIRTRPLNHPDGATGYRIEYAGKAVAYITDTEHRPGSLDGNVLELVRGAGLMIYDSTFTDEEFAAHVGWGHSTWQEAVRLADAAGVGTLALFHHEPGHDDAFMDKIAAEAVARRPSTIVAREGATITL